MTLEMKTGVDLFKYTEHDKSCGCLGMSIVLLQWAHAIEVVESRWLKCEDRLDEVVSGVKVIVCAKIFYDTQGLVAQN